MNKRELSNPASREGYADDDLPSDINEPVGFSPDGQRVYPVDIPGNVPAPSLTPGPGPSAGIPKRDLELSKINKQIEDIRLVLKRDPLINSSSNGARIKYALLKIEMSTTYLKDHS